MDPSLHRRHYVITKFSHPEIIPHFVEGSGETSSTDRTLEPQHRFYPLLYATMVLLEPVV
jgi:hypothetical protein